MRLPFEGAPFDAVSGAGQYICVSRCSVLEVDDHAAVCVPALAAKCWTPTQPPRRATGSAK